MRQIEYQLIDPDDGSRVPLPDVESWDLSPIRGEQGAVRINYPRTGKNFDALIRHVLDDRDVRLAVRVDGVERPELTVIISESSGDTADPEAVWTFSGRFLTQLLDEAVVEPDTESDFGEDPDAEREFSSKNAGQIIRELAFEAQARGALDGVVITFTDSHDSGGQPWSRITTTTIAPGKTLLDVIVTLEEQGMCEWTMVGYELRVYNPGTFGVDRTLQDPPVIFHGPRDLRDAPRTHSVKDSATTLLVSGAEGLYLFQTDPTALARRGRRIERYVSAGNIPDEGSLTAFAQTALERHTSGTLQITHGLAMNSGGPQPLDDFDLGDWVWSDTGQGLERLQVAQWSVSMSKDGELSGTVTLNDLIASRAAQLDRAIKGIQGGTIVVGTSTPSPEIADTVAPAAPEGLVASSSAYTTSTGITLAQVTGAWSAVTLNEDGSPCDDLAFYEVRWRYTDPDLFTGWQTAGQAQAGTQTLSWSPLAPGVTIEWQVSAVDQSGNRSEWSAVDALSTGLDTTPPPVPSAPVVTPYLGQLKVVWDGLGAASEPMPPDFARVQVHLSTTSNFTPSGATLVDSLNTAGTSVLTGLTYGTTYYVRLVAVDTSGNASAPSAQGSGIPSTIGLEDIAFKDVGNLIEDGSFEDASVRARRIAQVGAGNAFSFTDTIVAMHGRWVLACNATVDPGTTRTMLLTDFIPVTEGQEFVARIGARGTDGNNDSILDNDGTLRLSCSFYDNDQVFQRQVNLDVTAATASTSWQEFSAVIATLDDPQNNAFMRFAIELLDDNTTGTWYVDIAEVRERIGTLLIQDLAVTNAKIASMDVGKLTTGLLEADVTVSGRIKTSTSGPRIEINNEGLFKYDANDNVLVEISEGNVIITGSLQTKTTTSSRIELGRGDARDNTIYYDVNGDEILVFGQIYNQLTGDPMTNGILVEHGPDGEDIFKAYGSYEAGMEANLGVSVRQPIAKREILNLRAFDRNFIRLGANEGFPDEPYLFLGDVYAGTTWEGQGFFGVNGSDVNYIWVSEQRFYWKGVKQTGDTAVININQFVTEMGFETASGDASREGVTYYENSIGHYRATQHQFRNHTDTAWTTCFAADFSPQSSAASKEGFREPPTRGLDVVRNAPVTAWRFKSDPEAHLHVGPVLEDLPEWMRVKAAPTPGRRIVKDGASRVSGGAGKTQRLTNEGRDPEVIERPEVEKESSSYSLVSMIGVLMDAVRELDEELDAWRAQTRRPLPSRKIVPTVGEER